MYQRILVAIDGSECGERALSEAIRLAKDQRATLRAVHVVEELPLLYLAFNGGVIDVKTLEDAVRQTGQDILDQAGDTAAKEGIALGQDLLEQGSERVGSIVVRAARQWPADLIVMGTHGRHGLAHLFLGSVAESVVREAPVPVLLIRRG